MRSVASVLEAPEPAASPAAQFSPLGRAAAAGTLVLGAALQLAAFLTIPNHDETVDRLAGSPPTPARPTLEAVRHPRNAVPARDRARCTSCSRGAGRRASPMRAACCSAAGWSASRCSRATRPSSSRSPTDGRFNLATLADAVDDISSPPAIAMLLLFLPGAFFGLLTWPLRSGAPALFPAARSC